jgi:hypothetical protein
MTTPKRCDKELPQRFGVGISYRLRCGKREVVVVLLTYILKYKCLNRQTF